MPSSPHDRATELVRPFRALYPFAPHFLTRPAGALHYVDEGDRTAAPLLCVHGNPSWSLLFRHVIANWRDRMRVVAPDHLGCGLSEQPADEPYRLADHVANLEGLVLALDLRRITLLVHDWGGPIGLSVALRHPERFARIVITNTAAFPAGPPPRRIALCRGPWLGRTLVEGLNGFARAATYMAVERPMPPELRRAYVAPYRAPRSARATWRFVQDIPLEDDHPSRADLAALAAGLPTLAALPTLLLWGERDWCFTPAYRDELARRLPQAERASLPDAGHYLFEDDPGAVRGALTGFFARHPLPTT